MKTAALLTGLIALTAVTNAYAGNPGSHAPGDPIKRGQYCWVYTDSKGNGWWDRCASDGPYPRAISQRDQRDILADFGGGGDGGGGGGGGR